MKAYILTEDQKQALLKELELTKFLAANDQFIRPDSTPQQIAEAIHRRFHYVVSSALEK